MGSCCQGDTPQPPDPLRTAAAQTGTNVSTAVANSFLNNVNQITPQGALNYDVTGNFNWTDPSTGANYAIPRFTATQLLSPSEQNINQLGQQSKTNLAGLAASQSGMLQGLLGSPFNPVQGSLGSPGSPGSWDANAYLAANPDVAAWAGRSPDDDAADALFHYNTYGRGEGRSGLFGATDPIAPTAPAPAMGNIGLLSGIPGAQTSFANVGGQQRSLGNTDFGTDRQRVEEAMFKRLDPQLERDRQRLEQRLSDQGIKYGSQAYQGAMDDFNRQLTDTRLGITEKGLAEQQAAYNQRLQAAQFGNQAQTQDFQQAALRGSFGNQGLAQQLAQNQAVYGAQNQQRGQYLQEQTAIRNQPLNEITALMSGSQVSQPSWVTPNTSQIANTDVAGLINNRFSQDMANYTQQNQNFQNLMGGIFGALGGLAASDRRVKEDIDKIGTVFAASQDGGKPEPLPVYEFAYKDDPTKARYTGPMAQDVERIDKSAVKTIKGVKHIDRTKLGSILKVA